MKAYAVLVPVTYRNAPTRPNVLWIDVMAISEPNAKAEAASVYRNTPWMADYFSIGHWDDFMVWPKGELFSCAQQLELMEQQQCPTT